MKGGGEEGSSGGRGGGVREIEGLAWGQGLGEREEKTSRKRECEETTATPPAGYG